MKTLICVPVFNEADRVVDVLRRLRAVIEVDLLVVDDGSTDDSVAVIARSGIRVEHLIRHRRNQGPGAALWTGIRLAVERHYDALITIDSDGQHIPEQVPSLLNALPGADLVTGTRFHPQSPGTGVPPAWRLSANQSLAEMVHRHTGYAISDSTCGLRIYQATALSRLRLTETSYMWPFELWGQLARWRLAVSEVPITRIYQSQDQPTPSDPQALERMLIQCERILLRAMQGKPARNWLSRVAEMAWQIVSTR